MAFGRLDVPFLHGSDGGDGRTCRQTGGKIVEKCVNPRAFAVQDKAHSPRTILHPTRESCFACQSEEGRPESHALHGAGNIQRPADQNAR